MSENVRKLVGLVVMAALVVVGVAVSSGDDTDFTRNTALTKGGVIAKDAGAEKGGDCCDEALYRIGKIEDRLAQIEASLQQALQQINDAQPRQLGLVDRIVAAVLLPYGEQAAQQSALVIANDLSRSGLLEGLPIETAREVAIGLALGFDVNDVSDGDGFWSTRRGMRVKLFVYSRNGVVDGFQISGES